MDELDLRGSIQLKLNLIGFAGKVQFVWGDVNVQSHFYAGHLQEASKKAGSRLQRGELQKQPKQTGALHDSRENGLVVRCGARRRCTLVSARKKMPCMKQ